MHTKGLAVVDRTRAIANSVVDDIGVLIKRLEEALDRDGTVSLEDMEQEVSRMYRRWTATLPRAVVEATLGQVEAEADCPGEEGCRSEGGQEAREPQKQVF